MQALLDTPQFILLYSVLIHLETLPDEVKRTALELNDFKLRRINQCRFQYSYDFLNQKLDFSNHHAHNLITPFALFQSLPERTQIHYLVLCLFHSNTKTFPVYFDYLRNASEQVQQRVLMAQGHKNPFSGDKDNKYSLLISKGLICCVMMSAFYYESFIRFKSKSFRVY
jgi:hypothetical protein